MVLARLYLFNELGHHYAHNRSILILVAGSTDGHTIDDIRVRTGDIARFGHENRTVHRSRGRLAEIRVSGQFELKIFYQKMQKFYF